MLKFNKLFYWNWTIKYVNSYLKFYYDKYLKINYDLNGYFKELKSIYGKMSMPKLKDKNLLTFVVASQLLLSGCANTIQHYHYSTKAEVLAKIDKKIEDNTLTFNDVFYTDYGVYDKKTDQTAEELDVLVEKYKKYVQGVKNDKGGITKLEVDKLLLDNLDNIAEIIANKKNFIYPIYGSNGSQWFAADNDAKAPLNYFQQQFLLNAAQDTLRQISVSVVDRVFNDNQEHIIGIGIMWVVFGQGYRLKEAFDRLRFYIEECIKSVDKGKLLSKKQEKFLIELQQGRRMVYNLKTDGVEEYFSKVLSKKNFDALLQGVDEIFSQNKYNSQKYKK